MKAQPNDRRIGPLRLFVYGTLKRGYWNHDRYCRDALSIEDATVQGRLYELPSGIPVLQVPDERIVAVGTSDPLADVATQERFVEQLPAGADCAHDGWQTIHGELIVLPEANVSLPRIDGLESFRPGSHCLYRRVLVPISDGGKRIFAWCYAAGERLEMFASHTDRTSWP